MADLLIEGVGKSYGSTPVLANVGLTVASGTLVALLGASGSGKTTLLRLVCGFERLDAGSIHLDGRLIAGPGTHVAPERRHIGYVAQEGALFPHLDVAANIGFGLPRGERRAHAGVERLLGTVGLPAAYATRLPHELSGGEQQRVALARALAPRPRIVLLDEPFSSLDAALRHETRRAVADALAEAGATALLVTHDQAEALSMGREVAVLRRGAMAQIDSPARLYRRPVDAELARFLGEAVLLPGDAGTETVNCALGTLCLAPGMPRGDVEIMLRPEQIRLAGAGQVTARVTGVTFYGPDAMVALKLAHGPAIMARVAGHRVPPPGESVAVAVEGDVVAFARGMAGATASPSAERIRHEDVLQAEEPFATA
jgi:iron(III) transport system ATP-binding protein